MENIIFGKRIDCIVIPYLEFVALSLPVVGRYSVHETAQPVLLLPIDQPFDTSVSRFSNHLQIQLLYKKQMRSILLKLIY